MPHARRYYPEMHTRTTRHGSGSARAFIQQYHDGHVQNSKSRKHVPRCDETRADSQDVESLKCVNSWTL